MFDRKHTDTKIILAKVIFDKYILFSSINTLTVILTSEHHFAMFLSWVGSPSSPHIAPVLQQLQWPAVHFHAVLQFSPPNPFLVFLPRKSQNTYPASSALRSTSAYLFSTPPASLSDLLHPGSGIPTPRYLESDIFTHLWVTPKNTSISTSLPLRNCLNQMYFLLCVLKFLIFFFLYLYITSVRWPWKPWGVLSVS